MLKVIDIWKSFGQRTVLKGLTFDVSVGETLALIGPSGCGKSVTLRIICALLDPDKGTVDCGTDKISMVFQGSALLNSLSVYENLELALHETEMPVIEKREVIHEKLKLVGLGNYIDSYPTQLSGGQQKRVSFARAVVNNPKIILYDEPTTGLDPVMSTIVEDYMIKLQEELNAAVIVVSHQYTTWTRCSTKVLLMHNGSAVYKGKIDDAVTTDHPYMHQFATASTEGPLLK